MAPRIDLSKLTTRELGNIIALVSSTAKVERTFHYGPYGENVKSEGTQTIPFIFGYKGGYRMPGGNKGETTVSNGLYHYGQRYYDPTTGRWTQQDPAGHVGSTTQGDRFLFTAADPVNLSDPSGKSCVPSPWEMKGLAECVIEGFEHHEEIEEKLQEVTENFKCFPGVDISLGGRCVSHGILPPEPPFAY